MTRTYVNRYRLYFLVIFSLSQLEDRISYRDKSARDSFDRVVFDLSKLLGLLSRNKYRTNAGYLRLFSSSLRIIAMNRFDRIYFVLLFANEFYFQRNFLRRFRDENRSKSARLGRSIDDYLFNSVPSCFRGTNIDRTLVRISPPFSHVPS